MHPFSILVSAISPISAPGCCFANSAIDRIQEPIFILSTQTKHAVLVVLVWNHEPDRFPIVPVRHDEYGQWIRNEMKPRTIHSWQTWNM